MSERRQSKPLSILIVGRPNVGKSTLFNRLVGRPAAVVFNRPGVTRDLIEADVEIAGRTVRLMDSAGWPYPGEDRELSDKINSVVESALKSCNLILWIVDARAGRTGGEEALSQRLMPYRARTVLVVNKVDELNQPSAKWADTEFAGLPWKEAFAISAKHGRGIADLLAFLESRFDPAVMPAPATKIAAPEGNDLDNTGDDHVADDNSPVTVSILGRPNVGKSTLVNHLLNRNRMVVSDMPGTTRDAVVSSFKYRGRTVVIADTAGVRRIDRITDGLERTMSKISLQSGQAADVTIVMMDITMGLSEQDLRLLSFLWRRGVTAVVAANKWDITPERTSDAARALEDEFRRRVHDGREVPFIILSAQTGHGISSLMDVIMAVHAASKKKIRTPELNRRLHEWNAEFPTGLFRGKPGKLKYGVQTRTAPITFKVFVNNTDTFRGEAYRYLEKRLRSAFGIVWVPIRIELTESE